MFRTENMYGDYPTLEEIKRDYSELVELVGNVTTIEQAENWNVKGKFTIEVNGEALDAFKADGGKDEDIEWFRYETYGCLSYVYVYIKNGSVDDILFDVWSNKKDCEFIQDTSISKVEANYNTYVMLADEAWLE